MAFKNLTGVQSTSSQLPWANELASSNPELVGSTFNVHTIKLKPKGLIVECKMFAGWYFKSTNEYKFLITYLEQWVEAQANNPVLQVQLINQAPFFLLGEDDEVLTYAPWVLEDTNFYQIALKQVPSSNMNLTLPNVPSSSERSNAQEELDELAQRKANQARQRSSKKKPPEEPPAPAIACK